MIILAPRILTATPVLLLLLVAPVAAQNIAGDGTLYELFGRPTLGFSVSGVGDVNGDGFDDMLIGAPEDEPTGLNGQGVALLYSGGNGDLIYQWNGDLWAGLGSSVAGAGDVNGDGVPDVIIGASNGNGAAFVYSGADGSLIHDWVGVGIGGSAFGFSVSGAGDVNGDGFDDLLIGACYYFGGWSSVDIGKAYVYSGSDGSLIYEWTGANEYHQFGRSVAGLGDTNGDGYDDFVVASPSSISHSDGLVSMYSGFDGTLLHTWFAGIGETHFGLKVAGPGDINNDGFADVFVRGSLNCYAYSGQDASLLYTWPEPNIDSISGAGDVDQDGFDDLLMGKGYTTGIVKVYSGKNGSLLQEWTRNGPFGSSVSSLGDVDQDGFLDVIVGAVHSVTQGGVFVLSLNPCLHLSTSTISASAGGVLDLSIDFPPAVGWDKYRVLISMSGIGPTWWGVNIPLTDDALLFDTYMGHYPVQVYSDLHGKLDANGQAVASLTAPGGLPSSQIGMTYYLAVVASEPGEMMAEYSSAVRTIEITP